LTYVEAEEVDLIEPRKVTSPLQSKLLGKYKALLSTEETFAKQKITD
jgi:hypothetical protein